MRADFLLDYDVITVEREQKLYLLARLEAGAAAPDQDRRPLNISLVIDRSGSMAGSKIDYTRQAAKLLVQNMSAVDMLSVVLYNESVKVFLPAQHVQHKDVITQRISEIKAGGTTNLSGGWLEGVKLVASNLAEQQVNRVILMTDGLANRGITDIARLVDVARQKYEAGVSTTTMGLGEDFNEDLLMAIADAGGGAFYFIESPEVAPGIFQEELKGLLSVVGQNLIISLQAASTVKSVRQLNAYPQEQAGLSTSYRLGDIFGEEVKTLMLELDIPALQKIGQVQIATLVFEYDELTGGGTVHRKMEMPVTVNVTPAELGAGDENEEVTRSVMLLKAAAARRRAVELADAGRYEDAARVLRDAAEEIHAADLDDDALEEERGSLIAQARDMDRGADFYQSYSRKSMSTQAYFTSRGVHESTQALRKREKDREQANEAPEDKEPPTANEGERKTGYFEVPVNEMQQQANVAPNANVPNQTGSPTHMRWRDAVYPLDRDLIRIGRAPQNEIIINVAGISRFHCQIKRDGDALMIEDLGSTNGTHVHGQRIDKPHVLSAGDVVFLCDQRVTFEVQA